MKGGGKMSRQFQNITFSIDPIGDHKLLTWLNSIPTRERSVTIRQILRQCQKGSDLSVQI